MKGSTNFMKRFFRNLIFSLLSLMIILNGSISAVAVNTDYTLTGNQADDIITVAKAQIGSNGKEMKMPDPENWCVYFVRWAGYTVGANFPSSHIGRSQNLIAWFLNNNAGTFYYFRDANYKNLISDQKIKNKNLCVKSSRSSFSPQKGDIVFYLWSSDVGSWNWSHAGIVESYSGGKLYTVEGNTSGGIVRARDRAFDSQVVGILRPNYNGSSNTSTSKPTNNSNTSSTGVSVKTDGYYTIENLASGKMLNVYGSKNASDTNVTVYETDRTSGQDFQFISKGSGQYVLQPRCATSCALNVYGYSATAGSNVNIWTKSGNPTQSWIVEYNNSLDGYIIRSSDNPSYVLTADGTSNSSNVSIRAYNSSNRNQVWRSNAFSSNSSSNQNNQQAQALTIKANTSNVTLDWKKTQNITVTVGGSMPNNSAVAFAIGNEDVLAVKWGNWISNNRSVPAYLTGKSTGKSTLKFSIIDKTTRKEYVSTSINVTVVRSNGAVTLAVTPSNLSIDLTKQTTQPVTVTMGGDWAGRILDGNISNTNVVSCNWDNYNNGNTARALITGKSIGSSVITFKIKDKDTGETLATASVNVTVTSPSYTVTYNANGGTNAPTTQTKNQQQALTLSSNQPTREGYTFLGWSTSSNGSVQYRPGSQYTENRNVTLYAVWQASVVTIKYDANGGTNAPAEQKKTQQSLTLSSSQPTRDGYTFLGWSTSANGSVQYRPGGQYTANQNVTLYAVWLQNPTKASVEMYRIELDQDTLNVGESTSIHVIAVYSDNSTKDVTASCSLSLSDPSVASINRGRITAVKAGTTKISIKSAPDGMGIHATPTFTVVASPQVEENPIVGIEIRPDTSNISVGESTAVEVYAVHDDGIEDIITSEASINIWLSGIVELNGSTVTGLAEGSVVVFAEWNGYSSSTEISVSPSHESSYEIKPSIDNSYNDWFDSAYWREETPHLVYRDDNI